jgi:hypothetical protein
MAQMDFRDLFRQVAARPGMFLLCDSYLALASFISGCDAATERRLLDGFSAWVAERTPEFLAERDEAIRTAVTDLLTD